MTLQFNAEQRRLEYQHPDYSPLYIDFTQGKLAHRYAQGIGKREPLARAIGIKSDNHPAIIDATAGLGRDAFVLACCGCAVTLLERSTVLHALLDDALQRARQEAQLSAIVQRLQLIHSDALVYLERHQAPVIYLDPMYPSRKKSALVKQEMRILRDIVGDDDDTDKLFQLALQRATNRVVVKRPKLAPPLTGIAPSHQILGKTTRFDVYLS